MIDTHLPSTKHASPLSALESHFATHPPISITLWAVVDPTIASQPNWKWFFWLVEIVSARVESCWVALEALLAVPTHIQVHTENLSKLVITNNLTYFFLYSFVYDCRRSHSGHLPTMCQSQSGSNYGLARWITQPQ